VSAYAVLDDLPEALELPGHRFALGVQWHPEADAESPVIPALVAAAREYAAQRAGVRSAAGRM
jgi:putative glutamine amidotransferase